MKRAPDLYPKVLEDPKTISLYVKSAGKRGRKIGKKIFARELAKMGFEKGRILDVGCGSGEVIIEMGLAFPKAELVGLDLSEPMLELARMSAEQAGLSERVSFRIGDAKKMPFEKDFFDVVVSLDTLHVVDKPVAMMDEIERVLAPNKKLILIDTKRSWIAYIMPIFRTAFTDAEAKRVLFASKLRPWKFAECFWAWGIIIGGSADTLLKDFWR